jgi:hypothetical protein
VFLQKVNNPNSDYPIFMAVSNAVGHDRRGLPIYRKDDAGKKLLDANGNPVIWNDLTDILEQWRTYQNTGVVQSISPSCFVIRSSDIKNDPSRRIDAWYWDPNKNDLAKKLEEFVGNEITEIVNLGSVAEDGGIFYPGRHKRNYVRPSSDSLPFYSGTQILQIRPFDIKHQPKSYEPARNHVVEKDWILITRSGSTGRVTIVNETMAGTMVSEHVIRVICDKSQIDPYYVYAYLASERVGKVLMEKGIYASVVDHISPEFVSTIPIPRLATGKEKEISDKVRTAEKKRAEANKEIAESMTEIEKIICLETGIDLNGN